MDKTFYFEDLDSGEEFLVEAPDKEAAKAVANEYFDNPKYRYEITFEEAEMWGLDTYA